MGWLIVAFIFLLPFVIWFAIGKFPEKLSILKDIIKRKARLAALFYFFVAGASVSVSSSFYIERAKAVHGASFWDEMQQVFMALNDTGYYLLLFLPIIVLVSLLADKFMEQVSRYAYYHGGFTDPITKRENISLRVETFVELLNGVSDSEKVGQAIGKAFAGELPKPAVGETSKQKLATGTKTWTEVDEKAGWCDSVAYDLTHDDLIVNNSFPIRIFGKSSVRNSNACALLTGYVQGFVSEITSSGLTAQACEQNCSQGAKFCRFKVS